MDDNTNGKQIKNNSVRLLEDFPMSGAEIAKFMQKVGAAFIALFEEKIEDFYKWNPEMEDYFNRL